MGFCGNDARISRTGRRGRVVGKYSLFHSVGQFRATTTRILSDRCREFEFRQLKHKTSMNVNGGAIIFRRQAFIGLTGESYGMGTGMPTITPTTGAMSTEIFFFDDTAVPWDIALQSEGRFHTVFLMRDQRFRLLTLPQCRQLRSQTIYARFGCGDSREQRRCGILD